MIVKYKTRWDKIEPVEVERETEGSVWVDGRRTAKTSTWASYFDSWAEAHARLVLEQEEAVASLRRQLESANGKLGQIRGMKPPKESA